MINLFREIRIDNYDRKEPHQMKTWTDLLVQLIRIVSFHNDWDPARVPDFQP